MHRSIPARMVSPVVWTTFSILFFVISIGGLTRLFEDHRNSVRLENEILSLSVDLFETEALQTSLRAMDVTRARIDGPDSPALGEYKGWRLQGLSVLNVLAGKPELLRNKDPHLKTITALFSYLDRQEGLVRAGTLPPSEILPRGVSTQLYSQLTDLTREIRDLQIKVFRERESLSKDRQMTVFLLVLFLAVGLLSFAFSNFLSSRMKKAIQFQVGLLDQFILTAGAIKDWRGQVGKFMSGLMGSDGIRFLFVLMPEKESAPSCEVFWRVKPREEEIQQVNALIHREIMASERFSFPSDLPILHKEVGEGGRTGRGKESIEVLSRTLMLHEPPIVGMAGIGVDRSQFSDPISHQVFEGILSSLLNLLGSVRAIASYTEKLEYYAARDPLTHLYNQRIFWDLLNYEVGRSERHQQTFVLMVIDLDDFKRINDSFGHKAGDLCLVYVADMMRENIRKEDILFRYGGDEFCLIMPDSGIEQGWAMATRILEGMGRLSIPLDGSENVSLFVSIGIASWPRHAHDARELFLMADNMMYKAKRAGKNQCCLPADSDLVATFRHEGDVYLMLRKAVLEERFVPYFQPIRETVSGSIYSYEVLARLCRPENPEEIMPASEFIQVMERTGLVSPMDLLIRKKAFMAHVHAGCKVPLFLNLGPNILARQERSDQLRTAVVESGIDPRMVIFEITEREAAGSLEALKEFMEEMRGTGMRFAIDDFGSGFASFDYLRELPVSFVKIGGEIVRNLIQSNHVDRLIVESLVRISRRQDIQVIAETIESEDILAEVKKLGVPLSQGFFIGVPTPKLS